MSIVYIWVRTPDPWPPPNGMVPQAHAPPPMVWSPKLTLSGTRDTGPYMHTCMHASMHPSIHPSIHTYIQTHTQTYIPIYLPTYIPTYLHTYVPTYLHTNIHTHIHTNIHTYIHTYIPYIHTYQHTNTTYHHHRPQGGGPEEPYHHHRPQGGGPWGGGGGAWESWVIYIYVRLCMYVMINVYPYGSKQCLRVWEGTANPLNHTPNTS